MVMKQQEQLFRKEQMMRNERLAATGQIMTGVTGELRQPLDSILVLAHRLIDQTGEVYARAILNESMRVSSILSRYHKVASREQEEAVPVEVNGVLERVIGQCRKEIAGYELQLEVALGPEPLWIVGSENQMEQVLNSLLLLAARSAKSSLDHRLRVESSLSLKRVQVVVRYGALLCDEYFPQGDGENAQGDGVGFGVCRGILHGLGGDVRILRSGEMACRLEIELPPAFPVEAGMPAAGGEDEEDGSARTLTAMVLEPDPAEQRRLLSYWSGRGHRAIPISNVAEAVELLRRIRLEVVFCAVRIGGSNWVEFFDAVRDKVPVFILLADVVDPDALTLFPQNEGMVLRKPVEAGELNRLIERVQRRLETCSTSTT
jgi:CheY-like chemotaxis protein